MRAFRGTLRGPVFGLSFSSTSFHILQTILDPPALPIPFTATNSFPLLFPISPFSPTVRITFVLLFSAQLSSVLPICHRFSSSTHLLPPFLFFFLSFSSFSCSFSLSLLLPSLRTRIWSRAHAPLRRKAPTPKAAGSSLGRTALQPQPPSRAKINLVSAGARRGRSTDGSPSSLLPLDHRHKVFPESPADWSFDLKPAMF